MDTTRITRDKMLMEMAEVVARRSTCSRLAVGAIFALDSRPLSIGYNGVPSGLPHCNHRLDETEPCTAAVHAEANGIAWAARRGIPLEGAELFVTHMPCLKCAHLIINAGISRVVWKHDYRLTEGIDLLEEAGVGLMGDSPLPVASAPVALKRLGKVDSLYKEVVREIILRGPTTLEPVAKALGRDISLVYDSAKYARGVAWLDWNGPGPKYATLWWLSNKMGDMGL